MNLGQLAPRLGRALLGVAAILALTGAAAAQSTDPFLPAHGAVIRSGGLMSSSTLLVYDLREGTLGSVVGQGRAYLEADTELSEPLGLTDQQRQKIDQLLVSIARTEDKQVFVNFPPTADYHVWMQMRLDTAVITINAYGPPQGIMNELNTYLWAIVGEAGK